MSRKLTVPVGSEAKDRPLPSAVKATRRRAARPAADEKFKFPENNLRGTEMMPWDTLRHRLRTSRAAGAAMAGRRGALMVSV